MNDYLDLKWRFEVPMIDVIQKVVDENKRLTQNLDKAKTKVQKLHQVQNFSKKVRVKLSGDGTNIGKRLHVINFTFTLLDEGSVAYGYEGNHTLAVLKEPENYKSLAKDSKIFGWKLNA